MIEPYYQWDTGGIYCGDCLEVMPQLNVTFDCAIADPPYFKVIQAEWDRQWDQLDHYIRWLEKVVIEIKNRLIAKGSFYVFGDDKTISYMQVMIDRYLTLLNSLVWYKTNNQSVKSAHNMRSYAPMTERILFYTPQLCRTGLESVKLDLNNFVPLRKYFKDYQEAIGLNLKEINNKLGHRKAEHAFYWNSTQWDLPTAETYNELGRTFNTNGFLRREYEALRREYEALRREYEALRREYEALRRTFNATAETFDVISGPIITQAENTDHPTTKPLWLMSKLIRDSTNPGDIILDPFMGSGTTAVACIKEGRHFVGIEKEPEYCEIGKQRVIEILRQPSLFSVAEKPKKQARQLDFLKGVTGG